LATEFLTSAEKIGKVGNLRKLVSDSPELFEVHFIAAQERVIKKIGQEKYDELIAAPEDSKEKQKAAIAEAYFVLYYAAPHISSANSGDGFKVASGIGDGRSENMGIYEVMKKREAYLDDGEELLQSLAEVPKDENDNPKFLSTPHLKFGAI